jgi:hypothetical protein
MRVRAAKEQFPQDLDLLGAKGPAAWWPDVVNNIMDEEKRQHLAIVEVYIFVSYQQARHSGAQALNRVEGSQERTSISIYCEDRLVLGTCDEASIRSTYSSFGDCFPTYTENQDSASLSCCDYGLRLGCIRPAALFHPVHTSTGNPQGVTVVLCETEYAVVRWHNDICTPRSSLYTHLILCTMEASSHTQCTLPLGQLQKDLSSADFNPSHTWPSPVEYTIWPSHTSYTTQPTFALHRSRY